MSKADYLCCTSCDRKVYYRNEAGSPGDELPDGAMVLCPDCTVDHVARLLPPGGESSHVYEVRTSGVRWPNFATEAAAWEQFARVKAWPAAGQEVGIYRQTRTEWPDGRVHYGPLVPLADATGEVDA